MGEKWGYVDTKGNMTIPAQFQKADIFSEGMARVGIERDSVMWYGFIDKNGKLVIPTNYKNATCFSEEIAWVVRPKGHPVAIDQSGKELFTLKDAEYVTFFKEGLAAYAQINSKGDTKWGFCDKQGKTTVFPIYESAGSFSEGLAVVSDTNGKFGYIDKKGSLFIPYQFDFASDFKDGMATVRLGEKWGLINKKGKIVLNPQFDFLAITDKNIIVCKMGDQMGFCDEKGKIFVNPQYDDISLDNNYERNALYPVCQNKKWGYVNKSGEVKIQPQFEKAGMFQNGMAPVVFNEKVGFINEKGVYVVNPQYDSVNLSKRTALRTQFFNPKLLVDIMDLVNHKGIAIDASFSEIMVKYHMLESDFSKYSNVTDLDEESKFSLDYIIRYFVVGTPYRKYQQGYYYTWTEYDFTPSRNIEGIGCILSLMNNAEDRVEDVLSEINAALDKYELEDKSTSEKVLKIYKSAEQNILVERKKDSEIIGVFIGDPAFVEKSYKAFKD